MKTGTSLFSTIWHFEAKQLWRSNSFRLLTIVVFLIGIYSIIYGRNEVLEQNKKIDLLEHNIDSVRQIFADTLRVHDTAANIAGETIGMAYVNRPDGMAALSFGQRDIHKFAQQITNGSYFYSKYSSGYVNKTMSGEIVNPFKLMSGHLDLGFVLLLLFPLYNIMLFYNLFGGEKESGTLSLLGTQPVTIRELIYQKVVFRFFITTGLGLLLLTISAIVNETLADGRWWLYCIVFFTYNFCWTGIFAAIISLKKASGFTALSMVTAWLLFTMLLPSFLNAVLNVTKPVSARTELATAVQKANAEVWALPKQIKTDSFKLLRPYYANTFDTIASWEDPKFYRVNHYLTDYYVDPFEEKRVAHVVSRNTFADKLNYFSPALIVQSAFNELGGSNMQQMLAYDTGAYAAFKKVSRFTDDYIFLKGNRFTKADIGRIPSTIFTPSVDYKQIALSAIALLVGGFSFLFVSFIKFANVRYK